MKNNFFIFVLVLLFTSSWAQEVTISDDINLRSDFMYEILGKVDDKILLYRDKGLDHTLQIFDDNLWQKESSELQFEKKRIEVVGLVSGEKDFNFFYNYRLKGDQILACRKFGSSGELLDTATISVNNALLSYQKYFFAYSKNKRFVALFSFFKDNAIKVHVFDNNKMEQVWENTYAFDFAFVRRDFSEFLVTDRGAGFLIFEKEKFKIGKPESRIDAYYLNEKTGGLTKREIAIEEKHVVDYRVDFDNINNNLVLAGLYGDKYKSRADGYFILRDDSIDFTPFEQELYRSLELNNKRKVNSLEDFVIADLVIRADGGLILITEMQREFSRKSSVGESRRQSFDMRAYTDYYNEDLVVFSIHPDGKKHWSRILRKKQFSQDDGGYFSSFFIFKSPTELRLIFNDEIKQDNTVSEYILNPIGENERNIVMNTEYQKLKLRFLEGIQISTSDFIVPSERNNKFNLVKVSF